MSIASKEALQRALGFSVISTPISRPSPSLTMTQADLFASRNIRAILAPLFLMLSLFIAGCESCTQAPPDTTDAGNGAETVEPEPGIQTCVIDSDCIEGSLCVAGVCEVTPITTDAGVIADSGNLLTQDAGLPPIGQLQVLPSDLIEFGAQRLGVPVERDITVVNIGNAPLTVLTVVMNNNEQNEFAAEPIGNIGQELLPTEQLTFRLSHTPVDGQPDEGELNILHTGQGNLTTLTLLAEFKGDPDFNINDDITELSANIAELNFGEIASDQTSFKRLFLRNTGRSDSLLEISDLTLTPAEGDFSIATEVELPVLLNSWASGLCPDDTTDACPEGTDACIEQICVNTDGVPVNALALDLVYTPGFTSAEAILTVDTNLEGGIAFDVALTGTPTQPEVQLSPSELLFGPTLVNATPAELNFELTNVGEGPLYITWVEFPVQPSAFELTFNTTVPTSEGSPPLTLQPGAPALIGTVVFTPEAAEGYTGFITLHTNDDTQLTLPIGLSGTGVVCPANSEVSPAGQCVCSPGFNSCSGACVDDNTLNACGASCTDCEAVNLGDGTEATCSAGQCEYACAARWYDLNADLDNSSLSTGWDGCEYACPQHPALNIELCNGIDDNCDGQADEGLDPDSDDKNGSNNSCPTGTDLYEVSATTSGATNVFTRSIYPDGDQDWFFITVKEGADSPGCAFDETNSDLLCLGGGDEFYRTDFELSSPSGASYSMDIIPINTDSAYTGNNSSGCGDSIYASGTSVSHPWTRSSSVSGYTCPFCLLLDIGCNPKGFGCGFDDYQKYAIRVYSSSNATSCENYTLSVTSTATNSGS